MSPYCHCEAVFSPFFLDNAWNRYIPAFAFSPWWGNLSLIILNGLLNDAFKSIFLAFVFLKHSTTRKF